MSYFRSKSAPIYQTRQRLLAFLILCGLAWIILLGQLWLLQVSQKQKFSDLSLNNRIRLKRIKSPRGLIRDRHNTIIVSNRPAFFAALVLEDAGKHLQDSLAALSDLLKVPIEQFEEKIAKAKSELLPFRPLRLSNPLTPKEVALLEEHQLGMPGITVMVEPVRNYHYDAAAAHVLGYVGEISESQLNRPRYKGVKQGDFIGQYGLEKSFNSEMTGEDGGKQVEVNAEGRELQILGQREPVPGLDLELTLDWDLQLKAEGLMEHKSGALIALDPNNGEVLAMVSAPNFDPNKFAAGISQDDWEEIIEDPDDPLHNRVIQSQYPPGSVFKIVMAATSLEQNIVDSQTKHLCYGSLRLGNWTYDCWRKGGHGEVDIVKAIIQSCNVFFYKMGHELGIETIADYSKKFGFGKASGLDLLNEKDGVVPSPAWKKRTYGSIWLPGETISLSIGQGYLGVTPLQLANLIAMVANGGILYRPHIVKKIISADGEINRVIHPEVLGKIRLKPTNWKLLRQGLRGVVGHQRGTAGRARIPGLAIAGKTGTAQVIAKREALEDLEEDEIPEEFRDHAWFVAYAPAGEGEKPLIAMAILVEHGGHGGSACAPLAKEMIKEYFSLRYPHILEEAKKKAKEAWLRARELARQKKLEEEAAQAASASDQVNAEQSQEEDQPQVLETPVDSGN